MSTTDPLYAITMAAADLKVAAPDQFEALIAAFRVLEDRYRNEMFSAADRSLIFNAQGRAWLASLIVSRFANCLDQRRSYENRK